LTAVTFATAGTLASEGVASTEAIKLYTVYMPASGGTVEISATGGALLPVSGQVKVTAKATVTDSGAAALAAVNALATTVASLRTLITTLTNLVLKIQKKVKA
jgi:enamine deaminase RidA (YjgF/YER057c/UK114 family)